MIEKAILHFQVLNQKLKILLEINFQKTRYFQSAILSPNIVEHITMYY